MNACVRPKYNNIMLYISTRTYCVKALAGAICAVFPSFFFLTLSVIFFFGGAKEGICDVALLVKRNSVRIY